ncbi:MAG: hypothetical protein C1943_10840 [Halochromatium sp.]|nr:hypothetical protein [Halochromatium sp.]
MSLIIGVRCLNGCLAIADRRTHIRFGNRRLYRDDFTKIIKRMDHLVWNHGYNRIGNQDWKQRASELSPDAANPIFAEIRREMMSKADRRAYYVFMNMTTLLEVMICARTGVTMRDHMPHDRILSGSGSKYVSLRLLADLAYQSSAHVQGPLVETFKTAHAQMMRRHGIELSEMFDLARLDADIAA